MSEISTLTAGTSYIGTTTGTLRGERSYHELTFVASRDQDVEPFVRQCGETPDQDRVFVADPLGHGSVPRLVVAGSIRLVNEPRYSGLADVPR